MASKTVNDRERAATKTVVETMSHSGGPFDFSVAEAFDLLADTVDDLRHMFGDDPQRFEASDDIAVFGSNC